MQLLSQVKSPMQSPVQRLEPRLLFAAGSLVAQDKLPITYTAANGVAVTVSLKGPGKVSLEFADTSAAKGDPTSIVLSETGSKTQITFSSNSPVLLRNLSGSPVGKFLAPMANVVGSVNLEGVGQLTLRDLTAADVNVGAAVPNGSYTFGSVFDTKMTFAGNLKALNLPAYQTTDSIVETLSLASASSVKIGDFKGTLTASGDLKKTQFGNVISSTLTLAGKAPIVVVGSLSAVTLTAPSPTVTAGGINASTIKGTVGIGNVKVAGTLVGTTLISAGSIGAVTTGAISASTIAAGVSEVPVTFPTAPAFTNPAASIKSVTTARIGGSFSNSLVVAPTVGRLSLGAIATGNGGRTYGVYGDRVGNALVTVNGVPLTAKGSKTTSSFVQGDFKIDVI